MRPNGIITLLTDFGAEDVFVGTMKGVILSIVPSARIIDITHGVPAQDVAVADLFLRATIPYFPQGTVYLAVVDPGVGGVRRAIAVETSRAWFVAPDNGLLTSALEVLDVSRTAELTESTYHLGDVSQTFHGRDVFAPVAGHLASGVDLRELGPPCDNLARMSDGRPRKARGTLLGRVMFADRFGNLVTNIGPHDIQGSIVGVTLEGLEEIRFGPARMSYVSVPLGEHLCVWNSFALLELSLNGGDLADEIGWRHEVQRTVIVELGETPVRRV